MRAVRSCNSWLFIDIYAGMMYSFGLFSVYLSTRVPMLEGLGTLLHMLTQTGSVIFVSLILSLLL